jgi:MFS family permease
MDAKIAPASPGFAVENRIYTIQWRQLLSLAALYSSIIIGWIAYYNYQPKLLEQYSFKKFSFFLIVAQGIILMVTPPIAGRFGDRYRFEKGHRLPIITAGMSFAAMVFMAVAFTLIGNPGEIFKWILPVLIIFWLVGMSIFTSPALSTLELFTPVDRIPKAMAVLTIVSNLIYALEPVIIDIIEYLGAPLTFVTGGFIIFVSGYLLKVNSLSLFKENGENLVAAKKKDTAPDYKLIFMLGCVLGLITTILFNILPQRLEGAFTSVLHITLASKWILFLLLVLSALISLPFSNVINKWGLTKSFRYGTIISVVCGVLILMGLPSVLPLILSIAYVAGFTILSVGSLPLAIEKASVSEKVFCVGLFFSGVALPDGIVQSIIGF